MESKSTLVFIETTKKKLKKNTLSQVYLPIVRSIMDDDSPDKQKKVKTFCTEKPALLMSDFFFTEKRHRKADLVAHIWFRMRVNHP